MDADSKPGLVLFVCYDRMLTCILETAKRPASQPAGQ